MKDTLRNRPGDFHGNRPRHQSGHAQRSPAPHTMHTGHFAGRSQQQTFNPISSHRSIDPDELRRSSARTHNLEMLLKDIFSDSVAHMAAHMELTPARLKALLESQSDFGPEIAEHMEKILNLPGGWFDTRRPSIDKQELRNIIFAESSTEDEEATTSATAVSPPGSTAAEVQAPDQEAIATQPRTPEPQNIQTPPVSAASATEATNTPPKKDAEMSSTAAETQTPVAHQDADAAQSMAKAQPNRLNSPQAMALRWLNERLNMYNAPNNVPSRTELRNRLGRSQSTVSTWLTGLRALPVDMVEQFAQAVVDLRLPIAEEFLHQLFAASPTAFTEASKQHLLEQARSTPQTPYVPAAPSTTPALAQPRQAEAQLDATAAAPTALSTTPARATSAAPQQRALPSLSSAATGADSPEVRIAVARAAEKIADVLQRLVQ